MIRIISSKADYRRSDYLFPREQSRAMQDCDWEAVEESWLSAVMNGIGWLMFMAGVIGLICVGGHI